MGSGDLQHTFPKDNWSERPWRPWILLASAGPETIGGGLVDAKSSQQTFHNVDTHGKYPDIVYGLGQEFVNISKMIRWIILQYFSVGFPGCFVLTMPYPKNNPRVIHESIQNLSHDNSRLHWA